ncbi:hypothetical protein BJ508DRAFT_329484 [Ascobolus immersus RN42]|uniref:Uncharacterized protein n=1 Tax=Ascobolus immersus RN42 TaxID=1160509 RepID=A0A3N4HWN2_ASCIM|nr:hypothetical protein BJ508DRAFT_329484 [Ascobolus immersus RN42]
MSYPNSTNPFAPAVSDQSDVYASMAEREQEVELIYTVRALQKQLDTCRAELGERNKALFAANQELNSLKKGKSKEQENDMLELYKEMEVKDRAILNLRKEAEEREGMLAILRDEINRRDWEAQSAEGAADRQYEEYVLPTENVQNIRMGQSISAEPHPVRPNQAAGTTPPTIGHNAGYYGQPSAAQYGENPYLTAGNPYQNLYPGQHASYGINNVAQGQGLGQAGANTSGNVHDPTYGHSAYVPTGQPPHSGGYNVGGTPNAGQPYGDPTNPYPYRPQ